MKRNMINIRNIIRMAILVVGVASSNITYAVDKNEAMVGVADSEIQYRKEQVVNSSYYVRYLLGMLVTFSVAGAVLYYLKRHYYGEQRIKSNKHITLVEVKRITQKTSIILFNVNDKQYLVAQNSEQVVLIDKQDVSEKSE